MIIKRYANALLAVFFLASTAAVAETVPGALVLQTVVAAAYERYPELVLPGAIRQQGKAIRLQASSLLAGSPSIVMRHENDEVTDNFGFRNWEGSVQMPLWLPGQRKRRLEVANATEQEAGSLMPYYKWRISGMVRELLWSVRIATAEEALARAAVNSAQALETDINKRVQAGELAVTDQILAGKESLAREIDLSTATANLETLRNEYRMLTGLTRMPEKILEKDTQDTGLKAQHPALVAASHRTERARAERDKARHEKRANPVLALGTKHERAESGMPYDTIMTLELSLPLGLKGQSAPGIADAERQLTEQRVSYISTQRDLEKRLIIAISEKQRAAQALKLVHQQQELAAKGLRLSHLAFKLGESDLFTLMQARTQALAADRDLQIRQLEQGRAVARHNQALGVILE